MKRIQRILLILSILALIVAGICLYATLRHIPGLMQQAGLPLTCIHGIRDVETFTDWLNYTDGYDYAVLKVDPETFTPPESWTQGQATIEDVNPYPEGLGCYDFHGNFLHNASLPERYTAWLYIPRDASAPLEEQQWFAAMYDASTGTLVLYRGHSFYGSRGYESR
ncbi:MAG: hypothetical protein IJE07_07475 [Clostridia bacterium]|nr:hypothetical protein [Clostridia bacterium]